MKEKPLVKERYLKDLKCLIFYLSHKPFMIINLDKNDLVIRKEVYDNISIIPNSEGIPYDFLKSDDWFLFTEESYLSKAELFVDEIYRISIGLVKSDRVRCYLLKLSERGSKY